MAAVTSLASQERYKGEGKEDDEQAKLLYCFVHHLKTQLQLSSQCITAKSTFHAVVIT